MMIMMMLQDRPVLALYEHPAGGGKLAVLGSCAMLTDQYIDKEDNSKVMMMIMSDDYDDYDDYFDDDYDDDDNFHVDDDDDPR